MKKRLKAFTLVEMLIVMGIIIILMTVGITAGRYAINRANDVAHQNAVDNFYTAVQAYYADHREFPLKDGASGMTTPGFKGLLTDSDKDYYIGEYMEEGAFDGGTEATYYYAVDDLGQEVMICVSLFGTNENGRAGDFYCNGNSFGSTEIFTTAITDKIIPRAENGDTAPTGQDSAFTIIHDWDGSDWAAAVDSVTATP
jgi:type II secretory pathway pseudopilin PulG